MLLLISLIGGSVGGSASVPPLSLGNGEAGVARRLPQREIDSVHLVHLIARVNDGGPVRVIARLSAAAVAAGHRVSVVAGTVGPEELDAGDLIRATGAQLITLTELGRQPGMGKDLAALRRIATTLRSLAPDVLHTHTAKAGVIGRALAWWYGWPCLHTYHGHILRGYFRPWVTRLIRRCEQLVAGRHHHHALVPGQVDDLAIRAGIGRQPRWHCLPIPVPPVVTRAAAWHHDIPDDHAVVAFIGRLAPIKDLPLWLASLAHLSKQRPVHGLVCGHGLPADLEQARAIALSLGIRCTWAGQRPIEEILHCCDAVLITSRNEGLPLVAVEAAGARIPVVAPPVGGLRDLARHGLVSAASRRSADLATALNRALGPDGQYMITRGQRAAALCSPAICLPRYLDLYRRLAGRPAEAT